MKQKKLSCISRNFEKFQEQLMKSTFSRSLHFCFSIVELPSLNKEEINNLKKPKSNREKVNLFLNRVMNAWKRVKNAREKKLTFLFEKKLE